MIGNNVMSLTILPVIVVIILVGILVPSVSRKELFFGVRIPEDKADLKELKRFKAFYMKTYMIICGAIGIALIIIISDFSYSPIVIICGIILLTVVSSSIYVITHLRVKKYKELQNWTVGKTPVVVVDTDFKREKVVISPYWFLIPLVIIIVNIVIGYAVYPSLPNKLATHWNSAGQIDYWTNKSIGVIYEMPLTELFITIVMFVSYISIRISKQQLSIKAPEASKERNKTFRKLWSIFMLFMNILILLMFTFIDFRILLIMNASGSKIAIVSSAVMLVILTLTVVLSIYAGQGGSKLKVSSVKEEECDGKIDRDDDNCWKLGVIYFNPKDPSLIVEKRFGVGWTLNFGNRITYVVVLLFILLIVSFSVYSAKLAR